MESPNNTKGAPITPDASPSMTDAATGTPQQRPQSPPPPSTADYWLGPVIGEGAFAQVHFAKHKRSNRSVAIKVVDQATTRKYPAVLPGLLQEQKLLSSTTYLKESPWVVRLWSSFHDSQCLYLVMELCQGGDLQGLIDSQNNDSSVDGKQDNDGNIFQQQQQQQWHDSIPFYLSQLKDAIDAIHAQKIVHCDIKPANILLTLQGNIKLADFGSALDTSKITMGIITRDDSYPKKEEKETSIPRGTAEYASPELIRNQGGMDDILRTHPQDTPQQEQEAILSAMDYWSFGCAAIALYTGKSPFWRHGSEALTIEAIMDFANRQTTTTMDKEGNRDSTDDGLFWEELLNWDGSDSTKSITTSSVSPSPMLEFRGLLSANPMERHHAWQRLSIISSSTTSSTAKKGDSKSSDGGGSLATALNGIVLPQPKWQEEVETTELKDGALGWRAFFL